MPPSLSPSQISTVKNLLQTGYSQFHSRAYAPAKSCALKVLSMDAGAVEAHMLVGLVALEQGDWTTARKAFGTVLTLDSRRCDAWVRLARTLVTTGEHTDALAAADNAEKLGIKTAFDWDMVGAVYSQLGQQDKAVKAFDAALALDPDQTAIHLNRASSLTFLGQSEAATQAIEKALSLSPENAKAHWMLARATTASTAFGDQAARTMIELLKKSDRTASDRAMLGYGAGKLYEDLGQWDAAFDAYSQGAAAKKTLIAYDSAAEQAEMNAVITSQTADWISAQHSSESSDEGPIFIIGQPRSGTTLVERIIAAHSKVSAAGELQYAGLLVRRNAKNPAKAINAAEMGQRYLEMAASARGDTPLFIDKLPENFRHVGWIAAMFPQAKFIHLTRHPMDSCFSMYKQLFAAAYPYSYDLDDLAVHFGRYQRLMAHFHRVLPGRILDVAYEDVVDDTEAAAKRVIDHLGLDFEPACALPHQTKGAVATASALQVREKAHKKSIGRWQQFDKYLKSLYSGLESAGVKGL